MIRTAIRAMTFAVVAIAASQANGQLSQQTRVQSFSPRGGTSTASRILNNPAVSPYLAIADLDGSGNIGQNYFTIVRPQIESRLTSQFQQQSINSLRRSVTAMSAPSGRQNAGARITGHPTRFFSYGRYFPGFGR